MPVKTVTVRRRRRRRKHHGGFWNTAHKALKVANDVKRLLNVEFKVRDTNEVTTTPDSSGEVISLNHLAQGDAETQRSGISVLNKSIQLKWTCTQHASATSTFIRMMLVKDIRPNGTLATIADILQEARINSYLDRQQFGRFQVLNDVLIALNGSSHDNTIGKIYKQLQFHTKYQGSDSTDGGVMGGQLLLVLISNEATNVPSFKYACRLRFIDN